MGSLFSKRKGETNAPELTRARTRFLKKQPRKHVSTQSLYDECAFTSISPNPHADCQPEHTQSLSNLQCPEVSSRSSVQPQNVRHKKNDIETQSKTNTYSSTSPPPRSSVGAYHLPNLHTNSQPEDRPIQCPSVQTHSRDQTQTKQLQVSEHQQTNSNKTQSQSKTYASMSSQPQSCTEASSLQNRQTHSQPEDTQTDEVLTRSLDETPIKQTLVSEHHQTNSNKTQSQSKTYAAIDLPLRSTPSPGPIKETANQRKIIPERQGLRSELERLPPQEVPLDDLAVNYSDLELGELIGSGNFGSVYADSGQEVRDDRSCASDAESDMSFNSSKIRHEQHIADRLAGLFFKNKKREDGGKNDKVITGRKDPRNIGSTMCPKGNRGTISATPNPYTESNTGRQQTRKLFDPGSTATMSRPVPPTQIQGLRSNLERLPPQEVPLDDLAVNYSDLELGELIGSGNFGSVYAGKLHNNKQVAVKSLRVGSSMTVFQFRKEAETMHKLRHPNLVSLLAICEGGGNIQIITEYMTKGALLDLLRKDTDHVIKFADIMGMAIQVVEGMCFLESKFVVHRDLRAAKVLVGEGNVTKIADLGLTRLLNQYYENADFYQDIQGSVFPYKWTAPEAINYKTFTVKSDVWSFGILLYEMVTHGKEPYAAMSNHESLAWVEKGNRLGRPRDYHCPLALYNIMRQCWLTNPSERPYFEDIKENLAEIKMNV